MPGAVEGRDNVNVDVFGMTGIPDEALPKERQPGGEGLEVDRSGCIEILSIEIEVGTGLIRIGSRELPGLAATATSQAQGPDLALGLAGRRRRTSPRELIRTPAPMPW